MNDFLREIQEDVERQRWASIWQRYGRAFIYAISAIVLAAGGWQVMQYVERKQHVKQTDTLLKAVKAADIKTFKATAEQTDGTHQGLASLIEIQLLENQGKHEEAKKKLTTLADQSDNSLPYDLARAMADDATYTASIFRFTALERSGWQAIELQDYTAAIKAFNALIQASEVPVSIVDRAKAGLAYAKSELASSAAIEQKE